MIVMVMKRYPTMDAYKQVLRGMKSYEGLIEDELRLPLLPASPPTGEEVRRVLETLGVLVA